MTFQTLETWGAAMAFHPVRRWLGVGANVGTVTLWDLDHSRPAAILRGQGALVRALTFDSTGRRLAVVTQNDIRIWDLSLDYVRIVCPVPDVRDAAFRQDGKQLVTGSPESGVQVWNADFETLAVNFDQWLKNLAISEDQTESEESIRSRLPVAETYDPTTSVTRDGRLRARSPSTTTRRGPDGQMRPDTPDGDTIARLEDARTSEILLRYGQESQLCIAVSPEGRFVATGSWDGENRMGDVRLWDLRSGTELRHFI